MFTKYADAYFKNTFLSVKGAVRRLLYLAYLYNYIRLLYRTIKSSVVLI